MACVELGRPMNGSARSAVSPKIPPKPPHNQAIPCLEPKVPNLQLRQIVEIFRPKTVISLSKRRRKHPMSIDASWLVSTLRAPPHLSLKPASTIQAQLHPGDQYKLIVVILALFDTAFRSRDDNIRPNSSQHEYTIRAIAEHAPAVSPAVHFPVPAHSRFVA